MTVLGPIWASTHSIEGSVYNPGNALGAPQGGNAYWDPPGALTVGWEVSSIPSAAVDISAAVEIIPGMSGGTPMFPERLRLEVRSGATVLSASAAPLTRTVTATRAQLDSLTARITGSGGRVWVDAVSLTVTYTEPISPLPAASVAASPLVTGAVTITNAATGHITASPLVVGSVSYRDPDQATGDITASPLVTGAATSLNPAAGQITASPLVVGKPGSLHAVAGHLSATPLVTGHITEKTGVILAARARTVDELWDQGAPRVDHVLVLSGPHAGERLPVLAGSIDADDTADLHTTGSLTVAHEPWVRDLLDPRQLTELAVMVGVRGDDGLEHIEQVGIVHATTRPQQITATGGPTLSVEVADRSERVRGAGMRARFAVGATQTIASGVARLLAERAPWLPLDLGSDPGYTWGTDVALGEPGGDPWAEAIDLCRALGRRLYVDRDGVARTRQQLDAATSQPTRSWMEGPDCVIADLQADLTLDAVTNALGVEWEEAEPDPKPDGWTPRGGIVWWEDQHSSVSIDRLGERARLWEGDTSVIHSPQHALDVATAEGLSRQGATIGLAAVVLCDPRVRVGEVVHVRRPELDVDLTATITGLSIGLGEPLMGVTLAPRRIG